MYLRILLWLLPMLGYWRLVKADCNRVGHYSLCYNFDGVDYRDCESHEGKGRVVEQIPINCGPDVDNVFTSSAPGEVLEFVGMPGVKYFYISELSIPEGVTVTIGRVACYDACSIMKLTHGAQAPLVFEAKGRRFRIRASGPGVVLSFECNHPDRQCSKGPSTPYRKKRMINAQVAGAHEFVFMARIQLYYTINETPDNFASCNIGGYISDDDTQASANCAAGEWMEIIHGGGSIIHENWILTVANKYQERRRIDGNAGYTLMGALVIVGDNLRSAADAEEELRWVTPQNIFKHPQLDNPSPFNNDIGLLKVVPPITLNEDSRYPICLPPPYMKNADWSFTEGTLAGWGVDFTQEPTDDLRKEMFYVIEDHTCSDIFAQYQVTISDKMICTENVDAHPCYGDGGGPAFCTAADGFYYEFGVISFASTTVNGDWRVHEPNVNTRVTEFLPWINSQIAPDQLP